MTILLAIAGAGDNWTAEPWKARFRERLPGRDVIYPDEAASRRTDVRYAAVWKPARGMLAIVGAGFGVFLYAMRINVVRMLRGDAASPITAASE